MPRPDVLLVRGHDMYSAGTCPADMYLFALKKYISCERVPFRVEKVHKRVGGFKQTWRCQASAPGLDLRPQPVPRQGLQAQSPGMVSRQQKASASFPCHCLSLPIHPRQEQGGCGATGPGRPRQADPICR